MTEEPELTVDDIDWARVAEDIGVGNAKSLCMKMIMSDLQEIGEEDIKIAFEKAEVKKND